MTSQTRMAQESIRTPPEKRRFRRCSFSGQVSVWAGTKRFEVKVLDASQAAVLVLAPPDLLRHSDRLAGSLCVFPFDAVGYPIGPLSRRIGRFEVRRRGARGSLLVLHFL